MFKTYSQTQSGAARPPLIFILLLAALCSSGLQKLSARPKALPQTHTVTISGFKFLPETLTVSAGDIVVWKNEDIVPHTATAGGKGFNSKSIASKASWKYVANKQGTYSYFCAFHPTMKAKLIVK
ncbi:MAG: cupredoxin domain-containing protein [Blastocatellia bacterium]